MTDQPGSAPTFDLDHYLRLPRVAGLALAPDGSRLVTSVATPSPDGKKYVTALWQLDPAGGGEARQVAATPAGIEKLVAARDAGTVVYRTGLHPGADDPEADERTHK